MSLPVRTTPEAEAHIRDIDHWWRSNRPAAPELFLDELAASFGIIGHASDIGRLYLASPVPGTRRILLKRTRYHLYYVAGANAVTVLAAWHGAWRRTALARG